MPDPTPKPGLSVVIIAYNEKKWIAECLESASFADEIIFVDSGSTDSTPEIAARYTDKIFIRKFDNFSAQKNYAIEQASCHWVFGLDADELISEELKEELLTLSRTTEAKAWAVPRDNIFMDRVMKHSGMGGDRIIRLFPSTVRYKPVRVHETPELAGMGTGMLKGRLIHRTYRDFGYMLRKTDLYSTLKATDQYKAGKRATLGNFLVKPGFTFFRHYILQAGFLDGIPGFVYSGIRSMETFQRLAKLWRMNTSEDDVF